MDQLIENLTALQEILLKASRTSPAKQVEAEKLRAGIPAGVLEKFDRWVGRGKKAVSEVRHNVCSECHMQLPLGVMVSLAKAEAIQTCNHCGRFLRAAKAELPVAVLAKTTPGRIAHRAEAA